MRCNGDAFNATECTGKCHLEELEDCHRKLGADVVKNLKTISTTILFIILRMMLEMAIVVNNHWLCWGDLQVEKVSQYGAHADGHGQGGRGGSETRPASHSPAFKVVSLRGGTGQMRHGRYYSSPTTSNA